MNFCHFFTSWTKWFLGLKNIDAGYLVNTTHPTVLARSIWNFAGVLSKSEDVHVEFSIIMELIYDN